MVVSSDLEKWEARYGREDARLGTPEPFVAAASRRLGSPAPGARALDVAGGLGRHAWCLAEAGYSTTLADISPTGLGKARRALSAVGLDLDTVSVDFTHDALPEGPFATVVVAWFLLPLARWRELGQRLQPGGHLLYVQPTTVNLERHDKPSARFLFSPGELRQRAAEAGLEVHEYQEAWVEAGDDARHLAQLLARCPPA
ncbi:MAG: methyltransferase domain-containing protein [Myxococcota bacterium]